MQDSAELEKVRQLLFILTIISLSSVHLALMQGVTWIEMAVDSASNPSAFLPALAESIKPETKCERCCELEKSHQQQQDRAVQWESKLLGTVTRSDSFLVPDLQEIPRRLSASRSGPSVTYAPETPPPRFV